MTTSLIKLIKVPNLLCNSSSISWTKALTMDKRRFIFTQKFNPLTGTMEWSYLPDNYDYIQEISRSDYGDMLWDKERNQLYHKAISKYVKRILTSKNHQQKIKVVDIGTGTGLLSMMVCREAGSSLERIDITAFECFTPMAQCAQQVIKTNGYDNNIKVINSRSDEVVVTPEERADLLVTEVFDTELIGEGALKVFNWALSNQLKPGSLIAPYKARIWCQLVKSPWLNRGHQIKPKPIPVNGTQLTINVPTSVNDCYGSNQLHDLQASQLVIGEDIDLLSDPQIAFTFEFTNPETLKYDDESCIDFTLKQPLNHEAVNILFWWDLYMDDEEEYLLSCAPYWAHPLFKDADPSQLPWRDHWMQAIYYLPSYLKPFSMSQGESLKINCFHDEFSFWFDVTSSSSYNFCSCGIHNNLSRNRLRMLTDEQRLSTLYRCMLTEIKGKQSAMKILFIGDASLIPILIGKELNDLSQIFCLKRGQPVNSVFYQEFGQANEVSDKIVIVENISDIQGVVFDLILAEPYFNSISLPWDCLHFWYLLGELEKKGLINSSTSIFPQKGRLKALPVSFDHLWKIKAKLGKSVEGFDLTDFDRLIEHAKIISDSVIEPQPLQEYPCNALSNEPLTLFEWDFKNEKVTINSKYSLEKIISVDNSLSNNNIAMAFWIDFDFNSETLTTGPVEPIKLNNKVHWNKDWRQGIAFLFTNLSNQNFPDPHPQIFVKVDYQCNSGIMELHYKYIISN